MTEWIVSEAGTAFGMLASRLVMQGEITLKYRPGAKRLIRSLCGELFDYTLSMSIELLAPWWLARRMY